MNRIFRSFLAAAAFAALAPAGAEPASATRLVADKSQIAFVSKQMGVPVEGSFKKFDAQVAFDPKKPEGGSVALPPSGFFEIGRAHV